MSKIKASIILATYNWPTSLDIILEHLSMQLVNHPEVELVIADDGSSSSTLEIINKYSSQILQLKHVWHEDIGFRKSIILNKSVGMSTGEYLIFLDGDCIPFPDYIEQHLKLLEPNYLVAGNRVLLSKNFTDEILLNKDKINRIFKWSYFDWIYAKICKKVNKVIPKLRLGQGAWRYFRKSNWRYPKGCNFAISKKDLMLVNGFDENFSGWGHEDADLFVRLLHRGIKIKDGRFAIPVLHLWHETADKTNEYKNTQILYSRLHNIKKHNHR